MDNVKFTLKELRIRKGWTQADTAEALNISFPTYSKWENYTESVTVAKIKKVAELFGVTIDDVCLTNKTKAKKIR